MRTFLDKLDDYHFIEYSPYLQAQDAACQWNRLTTVCFICRAYGVSEPVTQAERLWMWAYSPLTVTLKKGSAP
jgi:hypothetical protein